MKGSFIMKEQSKFDYSISMIRFISTIFIITCHVMQYLDIELAWWFNVGVQIFLCMSGFLYGKRKKISDDLKFYKKSFQKILIDYYVVVIVAFLMLAVFFSEKVSIFTLIKVLLLYGNLSGGEHLWYIPYCLFCYLITPFLSRYFDYSKSKYRFIRFLLLSIIVIVVTETFLNYFRSAWIFCYILGFFLGRISIEVNDRLYKNISVLIVSMAILLNAIRIIQDYVVKFELEGILANLYIRFSNYAHVALGVALFLLFKLCFAKVFKKGYPNFVKTICSYSDKYSYDVYLVHQFVILGPFSLMDLTKHIGINLALIVMFIIISAVIVNSASNHIRNKIIVKIDSLI